MDKKEYVSPQYELLKFDSRIVTTVTSQKCYQAVVSVVYDPARVSECQTSDTTATMWNDEW